MNFEKLNNIFCLWNLPKNMFQLKIILEMFRSLFYDKHVFSLQYYCATGVSPWFQGDLSPEVSVLEATGDILPHKIAIGTATK